MTKYTIQPMIDRLPDHSFLKRYCEYAGALTDAYPEYHLHNGLAILSGVAARRVHIHLTTGWTYPNLWTLSLGQSSTSKKSTAVSIAKDVYNTARRHTETIPLMLPAETSPQGLVSTIATRTTYTLKDGKTKVVENPLMFPAQRPFWRDEWSGFVEGLKRGWAETLKTILMVMHDCDDSYVRTLRSEQIELENIYLPINSSTTPEGLADLTVHPRDYVSGWMPRFLITHPTYQKNTKYVGEFTDGMNMQKDEIVKHLVKIDALIGFDSRRIRLADAALVHWNEWVDQNQQKLTAGDDNELAASLFARLATYALKIATLVHISNLRLDSVFNNVVSGDAISYTIQLVDEFYYPDALEFAELCRITDDRNNVDKVEAIIKRYSPVAHSTALKNSHLRSADFKDAIATLEEREDIRVDIIEGMTKPIITYHYKNSGDNSQVRTIHTVHSLSRDVRIEENECSIEVKESGESSELVNYPTDLDNSQELKAAVEHIPTEELVKDIIRLKFAYMHNENIHNVENINIKNFEIFVNIQEPKYAQNKAQRERVHHTLTAKQEVWKYAPQDF